MKTKEAIEFLTQQGGYCPQRHIRANYHIINTMLQRGEKFEKMWKEEKYDLQALKQKAEKNVEIDSLRSFSIAYGNTERLEQKYFPNEAKADGS